jgi:uncharacterized protein (TIGR02722 family)
MRTYIILLLVCVGLVLAGCGGKSVKRVETEKVIDISGRWNDTDSRLVSEEMIQDALNRPWLQNYRNLSGKNPVVIVGTVRNRSHEHINVQTFVKDLERALINSGEVEFVASRLEREDIRDERRDQARYASEETAKAFGEEVGADYMLHGTINTIVDREGGKEVKFYQVNLEFTDLETNKKAWIGEKKIKKYIKRSRFGP